MVGQGNLNFGIFFLMGYTEYTLTKRICSPESKFFPSRVPSYFKVILLELPNLKCKLTFCFVKKICKNVKCQGKIREK